MEYIDLTKENAHLASTVISKTNPEWGVKRFNYNEQPLNDGESCSTVGSGSNSSVLFEEEYRFWSIVSMKEERKNESSTNLLSLFDNISIDKTQAISERDKRYCEEITECFESTSKQLCKWHKVFVDAASEDTNDMFEVKEYSSGLIEVKEKFIYPENITDEQRYNLLKFSPLFDIKHIEKLHKKLLYRFEGDIVSFFNKMYSLRVSNEEVLKDTSLGDTPDYMSVVSYILSSLEGKTFDEVAEQHIINDFKSSISWREHIELKGNNLVIKDHLWLESNWSSGLKVSYNSENKVKELCKALGYFDGSKHYNQPFNIIDEWDDRNIDTSKPYSLKTTKATSVRIFKNGRIDIKFVDGQTAQDFYTFYQLNEVVK